MEPPSGTGNRRGCFILAGVIIAVIALLMLIGFNGDPRNAVEEDIPTTGPAPN